MGGIGLGCAGLGLARKIDNLNAAVAAQAFALYDPYDLTSLRQDIAGTTPVTAHDDPVGLVLDKKHMGGKSAADYMAANGITNPLDCPGYHLGQATNTKRPKYRINGAGRSLKGDGIDDCLQSITTMALSHTDKVMVCAAVRKLSDAAAAAVLELSSSPFSTNGTFAFLAPSTLGGNNISWYSRGTTLAGVSPVGNLPAPMSAIVTGVGNISAPLARFYLNNTTQIPENTATQGTGNYGNHTLNVFARDNGASLPFSGHIGGLIIADHISNDDRALFEAWLNKRRVPA